MPRAPTRTAATRASTRHELPGRMICALLDSSIPRDEIFADILPWLRRGADARILAGPAFISRFIPAESRMGLDATGTVDGKERRQSRHPKRCTRSGGCPDAPD